MNIQQLNYIIALAECKNFELAAQKSFVTQSTLSTMVSKFEDEIGFLIFDRKKKPLSLTAEGSQILEQIQRIVHDFHQMDELIMELKGELKGSLQMAVIPTVAPFLLPLFLQKYSNSFPEVQIKVTEQTTSEIIRRIKSRELDIGILSTPLHEVDLLEYPLYDEPFLYFNYASTVSDQINMDDIDMSHLFLLQEGHCMRNQIVQLCEMHGSKMNAVYNFEYKAGSIDSLLRFVKLNKGVTLLPQLSTIDMLPDDQKRLSQFKDQVPYREIGIVVHRHFFKKKLLQGLIQCIKKEVETVLPSLKTAHVKKLNPVP